MDADDIGDLRHGHRFEVRDALVHEVALALDDLLPDVGDGLLPLVQALDEKFSGADFFADVILHLGIVFALRHQVFIDVADAEMRHVVVVGGDGEILTHFGHEDFGRDVLLGIRQKGATRPRFKPGDLGERFLNFIHVTAGAARDFRNAALAEGFHEVADNAVFKRFLLGFPLKLEHEALAQVGRTDAGRVEGLNDFEYLGDLFRRQIV